MAKIKRTSHGGFTPISVNIPPMVHVDMARGPDMTGVARIDHVRVSSRQFMRMNVADLDLSSLEQHITQRMAEGIRDSFAAMYPAFDGLRRAMVMLTESEAIQAMTSVTGRRHTGIHDSIHYDLESQPLSWPTPSVSFACCYQVRGLHPKHVHKKHKTLHNYYQERAAHGTEYVRAPLLLEQLIDRI